ncbi:MAG: hypothetical protein ABI444_00940 [Candidatus Kapaibacterium sp.]|jgi:hypothetical protein
MKLFFAVAIFVCWFDLSNAFAQPSACLELFERVVNQSDWINLDSTRVDTCSDSPTHNQLFATRWFRVIFDSFAILPIPPVGHDTVMQFPWTAINTANPDVRQGFSDLQSSFGAFFLRKENVYADSSLEVARTFLLSFYNYVNVDSVKVALAAIPRLASKFVSLPVRLIGAVSDKERKLPSPAPYPDPCRDFLFLPFDCLSGSPPCVYTLLGRRVGEVTYEQVREGLFRFDIRRLAAGKYFISCGQLIYQFEKVQ